MYLTKEEERIYNGEEGIAKQKAIELLVALGKIYEADKLIPVSSAQLAGVSYKTIGDAGTDFIKFFSDNGAKVAVNTYLNPAGMDLCDWKAMGVKKSFAEKQMKIIEIFRKIGVNISCTCTPYLIGLRPSTGEHIAWSESSAVSFANSVLGARTNREGGPSSLAAAIIGKTANYGYHLGENRVANFLIKAQVKLKTISDFGALGVYAGRLVKNKVPAFELEQRSTEEQLKALGAAMAASGAVALFFVKGQTPEWSLDKPETIEVKEEDIKKVKKDLSDTEDVDHVVIGCPHCSLGEIKTIAEKVKNKQLKRELWIYTSRAVKEEADKKGYIKAIKTAGAKVICDTCPVVSPIEDMGFRNTATNSGKASLYLKKLCKQKISFGGIEEIIE